MKTDDEKLTIREEILNFFDGDEVSCDQWLNSSLPALGGKRPIDLLDNKNGRAQLLSCILSMRTGDFG